MASTARGKRKGADQSTERTLLAWFWSKLVEEPLWVVAALGIAAILALAALKISGGFPKDSLRMEAGKALLQMMVVGVAGGLVSFLMKERNRRLNEEQKVRDRLKTQQLRADEILRTDLRYREDLLKSTLSRITSSYNNSKRARRNMRALALDRSKERVVVDLDRYDKYMAELNEAQLELETIIGDVKSDQSTYASTFPLADRLEKMEGYLGDLISEYEKARSRAGRNAVEIPYSELTNLPDFVERKGKRFMSDFAGGHREAGKAIREDLLNLTSAKNLLNSE